MANAIIASPNPNPNPSLNPNPSPSPNPNPHQARSLAHRLSALQAAPEHSAQAQLQARLLEQMSRPPEAREQGATAGASSPGASSATRAVDAERRLASGVQQAL